MLFSGFVGAYLAFKDSDRVRHMRHILFPPPWKSDVIFMGIDLPDFTQIPEIDCCSGYRQGEFILSKKGYVCTLHCLDTSELRMSEPIVHKHCSNAKAVLYAADTSSRESIETSRRQLNDLIVSSEFPWGIPLAILDMTADSPLSEKELEQILNVEQERREEFGRPMKVFKASRDSHNIYSAVDWVARCDRVIESHITSKAQAGKLPEL